MSLTRSPRWNEARRREEEADAAFRSSVLTGLVALGLFVASVAAIAALAALGTWGKM